MTNPVQYSDEDDNDEEKGVVVVVVDVIQSPPRAERTAIVPTNKDHQFRLVVVVVLEVFIDEEDLPEEGIYMIVGYICLYIQSINKYYYYVGSMLIIIRSALG
jgi:hypothetical protein